MNAIIKNRRNRPQTKSSTCTVGCPGCGFQFRNFAYGGWTSIICGGCAGTLYRNKAAQSADKGNPGLNVPRRPVWAVFRRR